MRFACLILTGAVLLSAAAAFGQWGSMYSDNRASTVGESWARGMSDVIRSNGAANVMNSRAAINSQEAASMYMDNRLKYTQTYFENRAMNRAYTAAERGPKITEQQAEQIARERAPKQATASQLDPITGGLDWPRALTDSRFDSERAKLEALFAERAQKGGAIGLDAYRQVQSVSDDLLASLKAGISDFTPNDYMAAKRFVESLEYTAGFQSS